MAKPANHCGEDRHEYGEARAIGGGILRRVCPTCGAVSIDLTATESRIPLARARMFRERVNIRHPDGPG